MSSEAGIRTDVPASRGDVPEDDNVQITMVRFEMEKKPRKDQHRNRRKQPTAEAAPRTAGEPAENSYVCLCSIPALSSTTSGYTCLRQGSEVGGQPAISITAPVPEQSASGGSDDLGQRIAAPLTGDGLDRPDHGSSQNIQVSSSQTCLLRAQCGQRLVIEIPPRSQN